jgi:hypothetical protein
VDTAVRASGDGEPNLLAQDRGDGRAQLRFDGALALLRGPAGERGTVVLER